MNSFQNITKDNLHHAHLVISNFDLIKDELFSFFQNELGVSVIGNEFFYFKQYDKFLKDDALEIFDIQFRKKPKDSIQLIVLVFNYINIEAQNKMLKMLEEPKDRTYFFIVAPNKNLFLETIFSRVNLIENKDQKIESDAKKFLKMNVGERIKFIAELVKEIKDEKVVTKSASAKGYGVTKQDAIDLLSGLEIELENKKDFIGLKSIVESKNISI